jgi:hypothetical protein
MALRSKVSISPASAMICNGDAALSKAQILTKVITFDASGPSLLWFFS